MLLFTFVNTLRWVCRWGAVGPFPLGRWTLIMTVLSGLPGFPRMREPWVRDPCCTGLTGNGRPRGNAGAAESTLVLCNQRGTGNDGEETLVSSVSSAQSGGCAVDRDVHRSCGIPPDVRSSGRADARSAGDCERGWAQRGASSSTWPTRSSRCCRSGWLFVSCGAASNGPGSQDAVAVGWGLATGVDPLGPLDGMQAGKSRRLRRQCAPESPC